MIPKMLHRVHLGPNESQLVKDAWKIAKDIHSDWECLTHNETSLDQFPIVRDYLDFSEKYSFKSDLMRLEALYNWGGIYIDTDIFCVRSFNGILNLGSIVVGYEGDVHLGSAVIASTAKNSKILLMIEDIIKELEEKGRDDFVFGSPGSIAFGPRILQKHLLNDDDAVKLPVDFFYPISYGDEHDGSKFLEESAFEYVNRINQYSTENTYCSHKWAHSWREIC